MDVHGNGPTLIFQGVGLSIRTQVRWTGNKGMGLRSCAFGAQKLRYVLISRINCMLLSDEQEAKPNEKVWHLTNKVVP